MTRGWLRWSQWEGGAEDGAEPSYWKEEDTNEDKDDAYGSTGKRDYNLHTTCDIRGEYVVVEKRNAEVVRLFQRKRSAVIFFWRRERNTRNPRGMATETDTAVGEDIRQRGDRQDGCDQKRPGNDVIIIVLHCCAPPCPPLPPTLSSMTFYLWGRTTRG